IEDYFEQGSFAARVQRHVQEGHEHRPARPASRGVGEVPLAQENVQSHASQAARSGEAHNQGCGQSGPDTDDPTEWERKRNGQSHT
ncbi:unnamed protein product, partial [Ectocarpus sp. 12 AP-2014]